MVSIRIIFKYNQWETDNMVTKKILGLIMGLFFAFPIVFIGVGQITYSTVQRNEEAIICNIGVDLEDEEFPDLTPKNMSDLLGVNEMWSLGYNGSGIKVAVLDTGIDDTHAELSGQIVYEKDFTDEGDVADHEGHGTVVAGIIASKGTVGDGRFQGIAPAVSLMNIKVMETNGTGWLDWVVDGIDDAVINGADVLSISLGAGAQGWDFIKGAIEEAWDNDVAVVVASGNSGPDFETVLTPGDVMEAITVGSCSIDLYMLSFSSAGPTKNEGICKPEIVAPGAYLIGPASNDGSYYDSFTYNGSDYAILSGTSVSTPVISGLIALLRQATNSSVNAIKVALMESATDLEYTQYRQGYGVPHAKHAYDLLTDSEWEPAIFIPNVMPQEPLIAEDVYDYPVVIITGKKYEGVYFATDLPILLPDINEIDGHYLLEIEPDLANINNRNTVGYIRLMSEDDEVLAEIAVEIVVTSIFNIVSLVVVAVFIIALTSIGGFFAFNYAKKRKENRCGCDPLTDPNCKCDL